MEKFVLLSVISLFLCIFFQHQDRRRQVAKQKIIMHQIILPKNSVPIRIDRTVPWHYFLRKLSALRFGWFNSMVVAIPRQAYL
jgi:hypothetical protein